MNTSLESLRSDVIGDSHRVRTPFGTKPLTYADYTASGRSLKSIEAYIQSQVLPWYANTHSESSATGRITNALREQARELIKKAVNAGPQHLLIFCGSGATSAINKTIQLLDFENCDGRPVVFIGPYEHHSNELPWREADVTLIRIPADDDGHIDAAALETSLIEHQHSPLKIGAFSAASNVTGIRSKVAEINRLLHQHGAFGLWDYAAAAPYVRINATGTTNASQDSSCDGLFISPHKFPGGPGTPGILIINEALVRKKTPALPGGGTVSFVAADRHRYVTDLEHREEGGTPAIVESIRAGLVFKVQQEIGPEKIEAIERAHVQHALNAWQANPNIKILGSLTEDRLSIVSFQVRAGAKLLHYGFVVALLNDLFGIQARGGCSCAGPYGHDLLGIDDNSSRHFEAAVDAGQTLHRPGWTRLNFNYFIDQRSARYIVEAVNLIASHGSRLLPQYRCDPTTGLWQHCSGAHQGVPALEDFAIAETYHCEDPMIPDYDEILAEARAILLDLPDCEPNPSRNSTLNWFIS